MILYAQFAHRLGKRGGAGEIEKHEHTLFPHRDAISPERDVEQHAAADQPGEFKNHPSEQGSEKRGRYDSGKLFTQPEGFDPVPI